MYIYRAIVKEVEEKVFFLLYKVGVPSNWGKKGVPWSSCHLVLNVVTTKCTYCSNVCLIINFL
jgi:hypothetical protein